MSFIQDYLDGSYPNLKIDLFISDLAYSIITAVRDKGVVKVRFAPILFDSDLFAPLNRILHQYLGQDVSFTKDDSVGHEDLWAYDSDPSKSDTEYEDFLKYISDNGEVACSMEDFRLLRLFNLYRKFISR